MVTTVDIDRQREPLRRNGITAAHRSCQIKEERNGFLVRQNGYGSRIVDIGERDLSVFHRDAEGFADRCTADTANTINRILTDTVYQTFGCRFQLHVCCEHTAEMEDRNFDGGTDAAGTADAVRKRDQLCLIRRENDINTTV